MLGKCQFTIEKNTEIKIRIDNVIPILRISHAYKNYAICLV